MHVGLLRSMFGGVYRGFHWLILGGSWVIISGVRSRVTVVITHLRGLITPLITTPEPPSRKVSYLT